MQNETIVDGRLDIRSMTDDEIAAALENAGVTGYRVGQITGWVRAGARSFEEMGNLPKNLRETLCTIFALKSAIINGSYLSKDGTKKYLLELCDGHTVESVLMQYRHGQSLCISTQVGCAMGCAFCISGKNGLVRNLTAGEMLGQIEAAAAESGERISNVVLMGIGEPLHNFENTMRFLQLAGHPKGLSIGMRHISLSSCGLCDKIDLLHSRAPQVTLSVSLHAPNDTLRNTIMPVNSRFGVDELLASVARHTAKTGRRASIEYALIEQFNDTDECIAQLASKLKGMLVHVNLIPVNGGAGKYSAPDRRRCEQIAKRLSSAGINATVRRTLGGDISASCGQLKAEQKQ